MSTRKQNVVGTSKQTKISSVSRTKTSQDKDDKEGPPTERKIKKTTSSVTATKSKSSEVVVAAGRNGIVKASSSGTNITSVAKKRVPNSPTSNRVSKTQYFPNKSLYSNALHAAGTPRIKPAISEKILNPTKAATMVSNANKTKSVKVPGSVRTPKPKVEAKIAKPTLAEVKKEMRDKIKKTRTKVKSPDTSTSSQMERPRTATLKRPSIVSTNIAGPDAIKSIKIARSKKSETSSIAGSVSTNMETDQETEPDELSTVNTIDTHEEDAVEDDDYEDDFDSYASDFEEYKSSHCSSAASSSEPVDVSTEGEETSSGSDSDEAVEGTPDAKRVNSAEEERKLDSGNFDMPPSEEPKRMQVLDRIKENEPINLSSLSDEGFEEAKTSLQFVNFSDAKKKRQFVKKQQKVTKRGEELMSMIRLDQQNFTLFDLPAKSYDEFIKSFGNRNSTQVASQTGEDRVEEEVQTDVIYYCNKWTQFPIDKITKSKNPLQFRDELLGVGSDTLDVNLLKDHATLEYNEYNLSRFLLAQEKLVGELLKENQHGNNSVDMTTGKFPFSQGYLILNTEKYAPTSLVAFSNSNKNVKIVSVHEKGLNLRCEGFVWSLMKPNVPEDNFTAFGEISDITFGLGNDKLIFGGFKDGCLAVWDLLEDIANHDSRPPSFLTEVDLGLVEGIVKVLCFRALKSNDFQIVTLDEAGTIIIWGLIIKPTESLGLNRIALVRNNTIQLRSHHLELNLQCTDLCLNLQDPNHLYVSTNYGLILHSLVSGTRTNPKRYNTGVTSAVNVLETCPHNYNYFLAGCESGEVVLLTKQFEKPLMTISNQQSEASIVRIQWSRNRPCIFYTQDMDNNINIWDLSVSELSPTFSIHLKESIRALQVSPRESETSYMAVITGDGKIHLHLLNQEHGMQEVEVYAEDLKKLNSYVQRL